MRDLRLAALALFLASALFAADSRKIDKQVAAITKSAILIDTHNDIPSFTVDGADIGLARDPDRYYTACTRAALARFSFLCMWRLPM